jgi:ribonuclease P protein subunit RPR2
MGKGQGCSSGPSQKHLHARVSYLYQAASLLSPEAPQEVDPKAKSTTLSPALSESLRPHRVNSTLKRDMNPQRHKTTNEPDDSCFKGDMTKAAQVVASSLSRLLLSQMRAVSLKSQIRLSTEIKRSTCKTCDSLLVPGHSSVISVENLSFKKTKPQDDVLVIECQVCHTRKRIPMGAHRQPRSRNMKLSRS